MKKKGLCSSCKYRNICTYKRQATGVYHCDEYVCGKPISKKNSNFSKKTLKPVKKI
ncbi:hypothetical protein KAW65_02275 [candidate division WOR-3 bacterium]|nr:hypothetical protein [candidate division WOR-3 bacterium]